MSELSAEEAFKIADRDFDGYINLVDMKEFLSRVVQLGDEESLSDLRLNRLIKLLDKFKRGFIQRGDFCSFLLNDSHREHEWMQNAKQQIALHLSEKYLSLEESFHQISRFQSSITLDKFKMFLDSSLALQGFNLTHNLIQEFFAHMDPHKKGFITQSDWLQVFAEFQNKEQLQLEELKSVFITILYIIIKCIQAHFISAKEAYTFFIRKYDPEAQQICKNAFIVGLQNLFPYKINSQLLWHKLSQGNTYLSFQHFQTTFFQQKSKSLPHSKKVNLNHKLLSSTKDLLGLISEFDKNNSGNLTVLQFRNLLSRLNVGLTPAEITELIKTNDQGNTQLIEIKQFLKRMDLGQTDVQLRQRTNFKIKKLKNMIYQYMLSPKDVFQKACTGGPEHITFTQFQLMLERKLWRLSGEEAFSYQVCRDLFTFIDMKQDGVLDKGEWNYAFEDCEEKMQHQSLEIGKGYHSFSNKKVTVSQLWNLHKSYDFQWEKSDQYEQIIKVIGRQRKVIYQKCKDKYKDVEQGEVIPIDVEITNDYLFDQDLKDIINEILERNNLKVPNSGWKSLLNFADQNGKVNVQYFLEVYRERLDQMSQIPKQ